MLQFGAIFGTFFVQKKTLYHEASLLRCVFSGPAAPNGCHLAGQAYRGTTVMEGMFNIQPSAAACQEMEPSLLLLLKQLSVFIPTYFIHHIFKTPSYVNLFFVPKIFPSIQQNDINLKRRNAPFQKSCQQHHSCLYWTWRKAEAGAACR